MLSIRSRAWDYIAHDSIYIKLKKTESTVTEARIEALHRMWGEGVEATMGIAWEAQEKDSSEMLEKFLIRLVVT